MGSERSEQRERKAGPGWDDSNAFILHATADKARSLPDRDHKSWAGDAVPTAYTIPDDKHTIIHTAQHFPSLLSPLPSSLLSLFPLFVVPPWPPLPFLFSLLLSFSLASPCVFATPCPCAPLPLLKFLCFSFSFPLLFSPLPPANLSYIFHIYFLYFIAFSPFDLPAHSSSSSLSTSFQPQPSTLCLFFFYRIDILDIETKKEDTGRIL